MGYLPLVIALIGASFIGSAIEFKEKVTFSVLSLKFNNQDSLATGYSKLYLTLKVELINPTNFESDITGLNINISHNKISIANIISTNTFSINPKGMVMLSLPVIVDTKNTLKSLPSLAGEFLNGNAGVDLKGSIKLKYGSVNINQSQKITV